MLLPRQSPPRDDQGGGKGSHDSGAPKATNIVLTSIAVVIVSAVLVYLVLAHIRKRHSSSRYIPTKYLKQKWERWRGTGLAGKLGYSSRLQQDRSVTTLHSRHTRASTSDSTDQRQAQTSDAPVGAEVVDRHASVRSVMTLPAYTRSVRDTERVLGREGERDGIDIVLEQPETEDAEEERREEEMDSLYQIRLQRRQEIADREARRTERRDARMRGDTVMLERLRREAAARAQERDVTDVATMIAEHRSRTRDRGVSSVSYASLGVARHDGSRIRANSDESDRHPLLDSAASIDGGSILPSRTQDSASLYAHGRDRSTSSVLSVSDTATDVDIPFGRAGSAFEIVNLNQTHSRNVSGGNHTPFSSRSRASSSANPLPTRPSIDTGVDLADGGIPSSEPPAYDGEGFEEAPPYTSPIREQGSGPQTSWYAEDRTQPISEPQSAVSLSGAPTIPEFGRVPSIRIASATPVEAGREFDFSAAMPSSTSGQR